MLLMPKGKHHNHARGEAHPRYKHGAVRYVNGKRVVEPEYRSWSMMRNRCLNLRAMDWAYYGGRGVTIIRRWDSYEAFLEDMGQRPSPAHTLERKNTNGKYSKRNCIWATREQQSRNRDYVKLSVVKARQIRRAVGRQIDIAAQFGVSQGLVSQIKRGVAWREAAVEQCSCS